LAILADASQGCLVTYRDKCQIIAGVFCVLTAGGGPCIANTGARPRRWGPRQVVTGETAVQQLRLSPWESAVFSVWWVLCCELV